MITENILIDLKPENYEQLFNLELNYKETEILTEINSFLAELNVNTTEYISKTIIKVKTSIKSYFESGITEEYIKNLTEKIADYVFQDEFYSQINAYLKYACGPESKIILAFSTEIDFHKLLSENNFYFNLTSYEASYTTMKERITTLFDQEKNQFVNNLKMPDFLVDKIKRKVSDFISESYQFSNEKINSLTDVTDFEFLNMEFSLKDITRNALADVVDNLNSKLDGIIKTAFDKEFNDFKVQIQDYLDELKNKILQTINFEYNSTIYYYNQMEENLIIIHQ
jgi:hypothetical protein